MCNAGKIEFDVGAEDQSAMLEYLGDETEDNMTNVRKHGDLVVLPPECTTHVTTAVCSTNCLENPLSSRLHVCPQSNTRDTYQKRTISAATAPRSSVRACGLTTTSRSEEPTKSNSASAKTRKHHEAAADARKASLQATA